MANRSSFRVFRWGLAGVLVLAMVQGGVAQEESTDVFSLEEIQEDFSLLRSALEQAHGGFDRYSSREEMKRRFDEVEGELTRPRTEEGFLRLLAPLVGAIHDGHTSIDASRRYRRRISRARILLPVRFHFSAGKSYVLEIFQPDAGLAPGAEVISVNGKSMGEILAILLPSIGSDAHVETSKFHQLGDPRSFSRLYALLVEEVDSFEITFRNPNSTELGIATLVGLDERRFNRARKKAGWVPAPIRPPIAFAMRDGVGELSIRTFGSGAYSGAGIDYREFLKKSFSALKRENAEDLLIDLRGNGGGTDEYAKLLYAYLSEEEFLYYRSLEVRGNEFDFLEHTRTQPNQLPDSSRLTKNERGLFDLAGHPNLGIQKPQMPGFRGRVTILIDGRSFSATSEFTSVAHFHKRATFVGEESGGGYYGNTSGSSLQLTLPNTRLRVTIPLVRYTMEVEGYPEDRGLVPDHEVLPTIDDLLAGRDVPLEFARKLIASRRAE